MSFKGIFIGTFIILCTVSIVAHGQDPSENVTVLAQDTSVLVKSEKIELVIDSLENRPNTAALYSAALPGLGQAYNNKYWKIPILYGGGLVIGYFINYNNKLYKQYRDGLIAIKDQDSRTQPFNPELDVNVYERASSYWRRNRDLLMIGAVLFYVVNIVDAHVDAHLAQFTVEDDLTLHLEPSFNQTAMNTNIIGLSLKLKFN